MKRIIISATVHSEALHIFESEYDSKCNTTYVIPCYISQSTLHLGITDLPRAIESAKAFPS